MFRADRGEPGLAAPRLIQRAELLASLDRATEAKVTLISAPAGSGKSSLLRAWADGPGRRYRLATVQVRRDQQDAQQGGFDAATQQRMVQRSYQQCVTLYRTQ